MSFHKQSLNANGNRRAGQYRIRNTPETAAPSPKHTTGKRVRVPASHHDRPNSTTAKDNESRNIDTAAARDPACAGALCACCNKILIGNDMPPLAPTSSEDP